MTTVNWPRPDLQRLPLPRLATPITGRTPLCAFPKVRAAEGEQVNAQYNPIQALLVVAAWAREVVRKRLVSPMPVHGRMETQGVRRGLWYWHLLRATATASAASASTATVRSVSTPASATTERRADELGTSRSHLKPLGGRRRRGGKACLRRVLSRRGEGAGGQDVIRSNLHPRGLNRSLGSAPVVLSGIA